MTEWSGPEAEQFASRILSRLRDEIESETRMSPGEDESAGTRRPPLERAKCPGWLESARVRAGWVGLTLVVVFEDAPEDRTSNDIFEIYGAVAADTAVLLDQPTMQPIGWTQPKFPANRVTFGRYGEGPPPIISVPYAAGRFYTEADPSHGTLAIFGMTMQMDAAPGDTSVGFIRYIPAALYVSKLGPDPLDEVADWMSHAMALEVERFANSAEGEAKAARRTRIASFAISKQRSVIVSGRYSGADGRELVRVRDYLKQKQYDAELISDLPDISMQSVVEKVRLWSTASRFCVMIDREASGHVREYEIPRQQSTIMALLRPRGHGSTFMIGDDDFVDVNYFRSFEFEESPLQVLDAAIAWTESLVKARETHYDAKYPWRPNKPG